MSLLDEILTEAEQGSELWNKIRLGKFTSSRIKEIICKRGDFTKGALTYISEKVSEILTGQEEPSFEGEATLWGQANEPIARNLYQEKTQLEVKVPGFIMHDEWYGGSPDGLIDPLGILEIKCPFKSSNHIKNCMVDSQAMLKKLHEDYYYQMQSNMFLADAQWGHFVSYDPRIEKAPFYMIHIKRDEKAIEEIKQSVENAADEVKRVLKILRAA